MFKSLLIIFVVIQIIENCPDRWALHKVDIWIHHNSKGVGESKKSISLYELDNHEMIEVTKANVSVLCDGMIKNFPKLKYLTLIEANISKIQPGAFQNLPSLRHLSLSLNHLASIERYQFQSLENLQILYLSNNQIENVDQDAFYDLIHLKKIYLDRNKIHEIDSKWFLSNNYISLIDLSFNNISKVQNKAFTLPKNSIVEIILNNNEIEEVEPEAIITNANEEEVPYLTLRLNHNYLKTISSDFLDHLDTFHSVLYCNYNQIECFPPKTLQILKLVSLELYVHKNPLNCDCVETAKNFMIDHELKATFNFSSSRECEFYLFKPDTWQRVDGFY